MIRVWLQCVTVRWLDETSDSAMSHRPITKGNYLNCTVLELAFRLTLQPLLICLPNPWLFPCNPFFPEWITLQNTCSSRIPDIQFIELMLSIVSSLYFPLFLNSNWFGWCCLFRWQIFALSSTVEWNQKQWTNKPTKNNFGSREFSVMELLFEKEHLEKIDKCSTERKV